MDVRGVGASPDVLRLTQNGARSERTSPRQERNEGLDGIAFSSEASELALARNLEPEASQADVRSERIEQARQNLERGVQQVNAVLQAVARRISPYI